MAWIRQIRFGQMAQESERGSIIFAEVERMGERVARLEQAIAQTASWPHLSYRK